MSRQVTTTMAATAGEVRETGQARPGGIAAVENSGLVGQNYKHVSAKGLHILCKEDSVLLGLIPECIKAISKGEHRVL